MDPGLTSTPLLPLQARWLRLSQLFEETETPIYALETKPLWLSYVLERQSNRVNFLWSLNPAVS